MGVINILEYVVLVNMDNKEIGIEEKLKAHKEGRLHRAFSIFIYNTGGELLIQKRAREKYHSGNKWSNTCCGHPKPKEAITKAAHRRLNEEMGFGCYLIKNEDILYRLEVGNGLIEYEINQMFVGISNAAPKINKKEAAGCKWINIQDLKSEMQKNPSSYAPWFRLIIDHYYSGLDEAYQKLNRFRQI